MTIDQISPERLKQIADAYEKLCFEAAQVIGKRYSLTPKEVQKIWIKVYESPQSDNSGSSSS